MKRKKKRPGFRRNKDSKRRKESDITKGEVVPFFGQIYNQKGELKNKGEHEMKPSDIMKMDWLVDNVVGNIPPMNEFVDNAKMVVELKGVEENKL